MPKETLGVAIGAACTTTTDASEARALAPVEVVQVGMICRCSGQDVGVFNEDAPQCQEPPSAGAVTNVAIVSGTFHVSDECSPLARVVLLPACNAVGEPSAPKLMSTASRRARSDETDNGVSAGNASTHTHALSCARCLWTIGRSHSFEIVERIILASDVYECVVSLALILKAWRGSFLLAASMTAWSLTHQSERVERIVYASKRACVKNAATATEPKNSKMCENGCPRPFSCIWNCFRYFRVIFSQNRFFHVKLRLGLHTHEKKRGPVMRSHGTHAPHSRSATKRTCTWECFSNVIDTSVAPSN